MEPKAGSGEVTRLRKQNEELKSRLERIAEIVNEDDLDLDDEEEEDDDLDEDEEETDEEEEED